MSVIFKFCANQSFYFLNSFGSKYHLNLCITLCLRNKLLVDYYFILTLFI